MNKLETLDWQDYASKYSDHGEITILGSDLRNFCSTILDALQRVEELETELVKQTIGESIEDIREARIETRRKYPHLFNV